MLAMGIIAWLIGIGKQRPETWRSEVFDQFFKVALIVALVALATVIWDARNNGRFVMIAGRYALLDTRTGTIYDMSESGRGDIQNLLSMEEHPQTGEFAPHYIWMRSQSTPKQAPSEQPTQKGKGIRVTDEQSLVLLLIFVVACAVAAVIVGLNRARKKVRQLR